LRHDRRRPGRAPAHGAGAHRPRRAAARHRPERLPRPRRGVGGAAAVPLRRGIHSRGHGPCRACPRLCAGRPGVFNGSVTVNGGVSFWWSRLGLPTQRPALAGDVDADVAIVGAGYTGLWAAYYLKTLQPDLRIVVLDQRFAGFGASGRNGGWLTNTVTGGRERYGRQGGVAMQRALNETVDEVIAVATREGIDADIVKGGELNVARSAAQLARVRAFAAAEALWPHTDVEMMDAAATAGRIRI